MSLPAYPAGAQAAAAPRRRPRPAQPVETLWHDGGYALIVLASEAEVRALDPDFRALAADGDTMTIATAPGDATDAVSRVFVPGAGVDEDPVTGSAHSVLVPLLGGAARPERRDDLLPGERARRPSHRPARRRPGRSSAANASP